MQILHSRNINSDSILYDILKLDSIVYAEELQGDIKTVKERYEKNKDSFVLLYEEKALIGYACIIPITKMLAEKILEDDELYDDNITSADILEYKKEDNILYLMSVVISPEFQNGVATGTLANGIINFLNDKEENGYHIQTTLATTVGDSGYKFLEKLNFKFKRKLSSGYRVVERKQTI